MKNIIKITLTLLAITAFNFCFAQQKEEKNKSGNEPKTTNAIAPASDNSSDTSKVAPSKKKKTGKTNKIAVSDQGAPAKKSDAKKPADKDKAIDPKKSENQKKGISNK